MAEINWEELKSVLDETQYKVLEMFLIEKKSVRSITQELGLGRTKVSYILENCAGLDENIQSEISLRKLNLRTHKNVSDASQIDLTPLTEEQVKGAYVEITEGGRTLTEVAKVLGKQRDTVKKAIIEYLDDDKEAVKEFKQILKDNQSGKKEARYFDTADKDTKKKMIFDKLNNRRKMAGKSVYPISMLEKKCDRLHDYFIKRNFRMASRVDCISENDYLAMLYDYPSMLGLSLTDKIRPMVGKLDEKYLGEANTSKLLRENPGILGTTIRRARLQIRILKDTDTLGLAMQKPRIFRTSPELMYAEIKQWEKLDKKSPTPFMTRSRLEEMYRMKPEEIEKAFNIEDVYGDDEYFDGR